MTEYLIWATAGFAIGVTLGVVVTTLIARRRARRQAMLARLANVTGTDL